MSNEQQTREDGDRADDLRADEAAEEGYRLSLRRSKRDRSLAHQRAAAQSITTKTITHYRRRTDVGGNLGKYATLALLDAYEQQTAHIAELQAQIAATRDAASYIPEGSCWCGRPYGYHSESWGTAWVAASMVLAWHPFEDTETPRHRSVRLASAALKGAQPLVECKQAAKETQP